jgi:2-methylcitrate dehydratase PrpD
MPPVVRQLAEWCAGVQGADIPNATAELLPLRLLDTTGLIFAGTATPAVAAARSLVETLGGAPQSTMSGSIDRVPAAAAALVHGVAAHCFDFDDTIEESVVHPGSVVVPTVVALAEAGNTADTDFRAAIAVGYEVAARIGAVAGRRFHLREMHPTGVVGPIAAAAAAGRVRGMPAEKISWAMGLACSMAGGLRAYARDGGWSKWLHVGWAAHGGIIAADLAARGFRGPEYVLNGGSDLYSALLYGETLDRSPLLDGLGTIWRSAAAQFKLYPCAHVIHPFIDAVLALMRQHDLQTSDVAEIECTIAPWAAAIVCEPNAAKLRFDTALEVIGSLPYQLAVAALDGHVGLDALEPTTRARADIAALASRVKYRKDEHLGRSFDGVVNIRVASGRSFGMPARLPGNDPAKVQEKFVTLTEPALGPSASHAAADRILQTGHWRSVVEVLRWLPCSGS